MNYCGSPIHCPDVRFLEHYQTIHSKPIDMGHVEKDYKYNPENDVDISLGIRQIEINKEINQSFLKYYWQKIWA